MVLLVIGRLDMVIGKVVIIATINQISSHHFFILAKAGLDTLWYNVLRHQGLVPRDATNPLLVAGCVFVCSSFPKPK
jgi:hypothetical protein